MKMKLMLAVTALAFIASAAVAQTYTATTNGTLTRWSGTLTSPSTPKPVTLNPDSKRDTVVVLKSSTGLEATVTGETRDGTVLYTKAISTSTVPVSLTFTKPLYFDAVRVSPSASLTGSNSMSAYISQ